MLWNKLLGANASASGIEFFGYKTLTSINIDPNILYLEKFEVDVGGLETDPIAGDFVLVVFSVASNGAAASLLSIASSGWTVIDNLFAKDTVETSLLCAYKVMGSTPDSAIEFTVSGTGYTATEDARAGIALLFRGVDSVNPLDVSAETSTLLNTVRPNPPSVTPTTEGAVVVTTGAGGHRAGTQTFSCANVSEFFSITTNDYNDVTVGAGVSEWVSGDFNPDQFTFSGADSTSYSSCAITLALRPA